jgi:hypothetical protein
VSEHSSHIEVKRGSERSFGVVFAIVFLLLAFWPLLSGGKPRLIPLFIALVLLLIAFAAPKLLALPNKLWFKLGMLLGAIIAPIVMGLVYVTTVLPTGLWVRLMGKDPLRTKLDPAASSYWIERTEKPQPMKNQF